MGNEATKLRERFQREGVFEKYFGGSVLDVGCGMDKILPTATGFDKSEGEGQLLAGIEDGSFDTVFSSHFLEHVADPLEAILNQWRVLRPGGYLIFLLPDEDLYEGGCFPSLNNPDHKHTFTISKDATWSPTSRNVMDFIPHLAGRKVISLRIIDVMVEGEQLDYAIEGIIQKKPTQPKLTSATLSHILLCPNCARAEMKIQGVTHEGSIAYTCGWCGEVAAFHIKNFHV